MLNGRFSKIPWNFFAYPIDRHRYSDCQNEFQAGNDLQHPGQSKNQISHSPLLRLQRRIFFNSQSFALLNLVLSNRRQPSLLTTDPLVYLHAQVSHGLRLKRYKKRCFSHHRGTFLFSQDHIMIFISRFALCAIAVTGVTVKSDTMLFSGIQFCTVKTVYHETVVMGNNFSPSLAHAITPMPT